jgi:hypothetical protein
LLLTETDIKSEFVDDDTTPAAAATAIPASWSTQTITTDNFDHLRVKDERLSIETATTPVNTMMTNELDDNHKQQTMDDENCDDSAPDNQHQQQQQQSGEQPRFVVLESRLSTHSYVSSLEMIKINLRIHLPPTSLFFLAFDCVSSDNRRQQITIIQH